MGEEIKKKINPNHQMLWTAPDGPEWEKRSKKKINPNHQMLWTAPDGWDI